MQANPIGSLTMGIIGARSLGDLAMLSEGQLPGKFEMLPDGSKWGRKRTVCSCQAEARKAPFQAVFPRTTANDKKAGVRASERAPPVSTVLVPALLTSL